MKIKHGAIRTVLIFSHFVVKFPKFIEFWLAYQDYKELPKANRGGAIEVLVKRATFIFLRGLRSNQIEYRLSRKAIPFFVKTYFSFFGIFIIAQKKTGEKIASEKVAGLTRCFFQLDHNFDTRFQNNYYRSHDVYSEDWIIDNDEFFLLDYGHNFGKLLAQNSDTVEKILTREFKKATQI